MWYFRRRMWWVFLLIVCSMPNTLVQAEMYVAGQVGVTLPQSLSNVEVSDGITNIEGDIAGLDGLELARLPLCLALLRVRLLAVALMLRVARSPGVEGRAALGGRRPIPPVLPH